MHLRVVDDRGAPAAEQLGLDQWMLQPDRILAQLCDDGAGAGPVAGEMRRVCHQLTAGGNAEQDALQL